MTDLDLSIENEDPFRELFRGSVLRAYHATRLLPHEVEGIRSHGLRLASEELVTSRLSQAFEVGLIDETLRGALFAGSVFAKRDADNRKDQVA